MHSVAPCTCSSASRSARAIAFISNRSRSASICRAVNARSISLPGRSAMPRVWNTTAARLLSNGSIFSISGRTPQGSFLRGPAEARMAEHDLIDGAQFAFADTVSEAVVIGGRRITIEADAAIAQRRVPVELSDEPACASRIERGADFLRRHLASGPTVYGGNTGYGDACVVDVPIEL